MQKNKNKILNIKINNIITNTSHYNLPNLMQLSLKTFQKNLINNISIL